MPSLRFEISPTAERDLREIVVFIALDNWSKAIAFALELRAKCKALTVMSERFPVVTRTAKSEIRRRPFKNYSIFYLVIDDKLVILRIVHGAIVTDDFLENLRGTP